MTPSFLDRLIAWAVARQKAGWLLLALWVVDLVLVNLGMVLAGRSLKEHLDQSAVTFYGIFGLAAYGYLSFRAGVAYDRFQPALAAEEDVLVARRQQITTVPARLAALGVVLGAIAGIVGARVDNATARVFEGSLIGGLLVAALNWVFASAVLGMLLVQVLRMLWLVTRLHKAAAEIDLFAPDPAHAFAGVTALAGTLCILFVTYSILTDPSSFENPLLVGFGYLLLIVSVLAFALPLAGMRRRLHRRRDALLVVATKRIRGVVAKIESAVDEDRYQDVSELKTALDALERDRDAIAKASTWPWDAATVSRFGVALMLPLLSWLITNLLGQMLGF